MKKLIIAILTFIPFALLAQADTTAIAAPNGEIFGLSWKWILGILGSIEVILRILPIEKKYSIINLISVVTKLIPKILDAAHEKIPNNTGVKMLGMLLISTSLFSACSTPIHIQTDQK